MTGLLLTAATIAVALTANAVIGWHGRRERRRGRTRDPDSPEEMPIVHSTR